MLLWVVCNSREIDVLEGHTNVFAAKGTACSLSLRQRAPWRPLRLLATVKNLVPVGSVWYQYRDS